MAIRCPFLNRRAEAHAGRELFGQERGSDPDVQLWESCVEARRGHRLTLPAGVLSVIAANASYPLGRAFASKGVNWAVRLERF
jgi:hypothetical protein